MSPPSMEPIDTIARLADLCVEAKEVLLQAGTSGLETIDQLVDLLLFEIGKKLAQGERHGVTNGGGGS